jgi:hypothetical protein
LLLPSIRDGSTWGYSPPSARPSVGAVNTWRGGFLLAQALPQKVETMDRLQIEKKGGVAGFGGPNLKSRGELALSKLSPADRAAVEGLFKEPQKAGPRGAADAFSYHITRQTGAGPQTIEVPESAVPAVVRDSVKDVLE